MTLEWYVVYTTAGGQRLAKEDLEALAFQVFMPVEAYWHETPKHRRKPGQPRRVRRERVLYPRYLFVGLLPHWRDFGGIRRSKRVQEIICDPLGNPKRIPDRIVADIMGTFEKESREERAARLVRVAEWVHMRVEVVKGPFKGQSGVVVKAGRSGVRVHLNGPMGATFPLEVPLSQLEYLDIFLCSGRPATTERPVRAASADPGAD